MKCTFRGNVTDANQFDYEVRVPKHILVALLDYFIFNTGNQLYFDGKGNLDGIEGVPNEIFALVKNICDVRMSHRDWQDLVDNCLKGLKKETLEALMKVQLGDG